MITVIGRAPKKVYSENLRTSVIQEKDNLVEDVIKRDQLGEYYKKRNILYKEIYENKLPKESISLINEALANIGAGMADIPYDGIEDLLVEIKIVLNEISRNFLADKEPADIPAPAVKSPPKLIEKAVWIIPPTGHIFRLLFMCWLGC